MVIPETITGGWRRSTLAIDRFTAKTSDFKRIKMGDKHCVKFRFMGNGYMLMDTGDLYIETLSEKLEYRAAKCYNRNGKPIKIVVFNTHSTYFRTGRKEVVLKDLLWAAFGHSDLPSKFEIYPIDGIETRIQIDNLEIRRKN